MLLLNLDTRSASAQTPRIVVHVHDAQSLEPVRDALVRLVGASAQHVHVGRTDDAGDATFAEAVCDSGVLLVEAHGFEAFRERIACDSVGVAIDVALRRKLEVIGVTHSAPGVAKATIVVNPSSPIRRINPSLVEALDHLAGVTAQDRGIGFRAGIGGLDPAMTEYSLNGVPLGGGAASLAVNSDLLASASVEESRDAIELFTASPTVEPHYVSDLTLGNYQDTFQKYQASGTMHGDGLGYVIAHTSRGAASTLNGQTYRDESGLTYRHAGLRHTTGNLLRVTDGIGATSVSITYSNSSISAQEIPTYFSGNLPAGAGPGTRHDETGSNPVVFISAPVRGGQLSFSLAGWKFSGWNDESSRFVALSPAPQTSRDRVSGSDVTLAYAGVPSRNRAINVSVSQTGTATNGALYGMVGGVPFGNTFSHEDHMLESSISESWHANPRIPFGFSLKHSTSAQLGAAAEIGVTAQYLMSQRATLRYSATAGTKLVTFATAQSSNVIAEPASAQFDCASGAAFLNGPGASGAKTRVAKHDLALSLSGGRSTLTVSVYDHRYGEVSLGTVPIVAGSLPADYFPAGYLAAVQQQYRDVGCTGTLSASRIFVQQVFAGASLAYRGARASARLFFSPAWSADLSLGLERARINGSDRRLLATPFYPGSFVPGVTDYKGNIVLLWQRPGAATAALLSTTLVGHHNIRQLPPYAVVNGALERRVSPSSTATLLVSNVFNTLSDSFVSPRFAVPLKDAYGDTFPTYASPLLPRRIELKYSVQFGGHAGF